VRGKRALPERSRATPILAGSGLELAARCFRNSGPGGVGSRPAASASPPLSTLSL